MRPIYAFVSLLALIALAGAAIAAPVTVDFSAMGGDTVDITTPAGYDLDGVGFTYENYGYAEDYALIDAAGVYGSPKGALIFNFACPTTALSFDYSLLGFTGSELPDESLYVIFTNAGEEAGEAEHLGTLLPNYPEDPSLGGDFLGTFTYTGEAFDQASILFASDWDLFTVSNVSYECPNSPAVPEAGSTVLALTGLMGIPGLRLMRRKR